MLLFTVGSFVINVKVLCFKVYTEYFTGELSLVRATSFGGPLAGYSNKSVCHRNSADYYTVFQKIWHPIFF